MKLSRLFTIFFFFASQEIRRIVRSKSMPHSTPKPLLRQFLRYFHLSKIRASHICLRNSIFNLPLLINISILGSRQLEAISKKYSLIHAFCLSFRFEKMTAWISFLTRPNWQHHISVASYNL